MGDPIQPPSDPFAPFEPSSKQPWNERWIGHLMRRAGFGVTPEWLAVMSKASPAESVNTLLEWEVDPDPFNEMLDRLEGYLAFNKPEAIQGWWVYRMINTPRPAQEKVALFWHGLFATSAGKVDQPLFMHQQIELFRRKGLGSFRELLIDVTRDPAMLVWLDGRASVKGKPNENYAREVMELFTLGIGNYSERDIKELARAMTGWQIVDNKSVFNPTAFDAGEKEIFGKKFEYDSESAIDLILEQPAASKHLSRRMLHDFVHPHPTDEQIDHYAKRLVASKWEIKPVLREMLTSRMFFSEWAYRAKIKSPVELAVGAVVALGGKVNTGFVRDSVAKMGQNLLYPPTVKGWDGEEAWLNANTVLLRFNFGLSLATQRNNEFARRSDVEQWLIAHDLTKGDAVVDHFVKLFLDGQLPDETRAKLVDYMNRNDKNEVKPFVLKQSNVNPKVRGLLHLVMSMPEYQLS